MKKKKRGPIAKKEKWEAGDRALDRSPSECQTAANQTTPLSLAEKLLLLYIL